jgi:FAD:protein FMN transferase
MQRFQVNVRLMGSDFELIVVVNDGEKARVHLQVAVEEIKRLEALLTEFTDTSLTAAINQAAGIAPVEVDAEIYALIKRCQHLARISQGAFDITSAPLKRLYNFKRGVAGLPTPEALAAGRGLVGYRHLKLLEDNKVYLEKAGMRIGFGAIGKGYAADCAKAVLVARGVKHGVINASGDLTAWGHQPTGEPWRIGIADPNRPDAIRCWLPVADASVATSGNYEQYFEHKGIRYGHTIDPRTGMPTRHLASVTVISPQAELSDALATAVTVMGPEVGLHLINQLPATHCLILGETLGRYTATYHSQHLKLA